jgi:hypothetical protein
MESAAPLPYRRRVSSTRPVKLNRSLNAFGCSRILTCHWVNHKSVSPGWTNSSPSISFIISSSIARSSCRIHDHGIEIFSFASWIAFTAIWPGFYFLQNKLARQSATKNFNCSMAVRYTSQQEVRPVALCFLDCGKFQQKLFCPNPNPERRMIRISTTPDIWVPITLSAHQTRPYHQLTERLPSVLFAECFGLYFVSESCDLIIHIASTVCDEFLHCCSNWFQKFSLAFSVLIAPRSVT